jgi:signal transduction histidine kinase
VQRQAGLSPERLISSMRRIQDATHRMEAWIGELIDVARLQAGQELSLRPAPTSLGSLVTDAVAELQSAAPGRRVLVHLPPAEVTGMWDATRLRRVVDNLLSNALKYSPSGEDVEVEVGQVEQQGVRWATLRVTDHGVGIPSADLPHLFEQFRRGRNVGWISGAGIGLAGAHRIVLQHGGRLEVTSREGVGSSFTLWLPIQPSSSEGGTR